MIAAAQAGRVASQREVARRLDVSHTALQKARRAGRIAPEPDGAWDVAKARALMLVHRLAKEERDAILAWSARVAAEMAAELGVDAHRLQTLLDQRLREHLAARHDVRVQVS